MALIFTTLFMMACSGNQTAPPEPIHIAKPAPPVATPVAAALAPPKPKPKPAPIAPKPIPPTLLSFVVEKVGPRTITGIDYETWPSGTTYTINLPLPCDKAVAYIHLMEDAVKQPDGSWAVVKCED